MKEKQSTSLFLAMCFALWTSVDGQGADLTIVSGARSEPVVDATIQRLMMIPNLFTNDYGLMKRIALAESNFGENVQRVPRGGIWQITDRIISIVRFSSQAILIASSSDIPLELIDIFDLESSDDFSIPLRSAFIARLFIEIRVTGIPLTTLLEQAEFWANDYNLVSSKEFFIQTVEQYEDSNQCVIEKMDLCFLVDGSGSVSYSNFVLSLNFVNETSHRFTISPNRVWIALTVFSSTQIRISDFNEHTTNSEFETAVYGSPYEAGGTRTSNALLDVHDTFENQARNRSGGVPRILVVLTDGESNSGVQPGADTVKNSGVIVYGVGVGSGFDQSEIDEISSGPQYSFAINDFDDLVATLTSNLETQACLIPIIIEDSSPTSIDIQPGVPRYTEVSLTIGGSVVISFSNPNPNADIEIFISLSTSNPSPALYDISVTLGQGNWDITINDDGNGNIPYALSLRTKRQMDGGSMPLFVAIQSDSSQVTEINLRSVASDTPADLPDMQTSGELCYSLKRRN